MLFMRSARSLRKMLTNDLCSTPLDTPDATSCLLQQALHKWVGCYLIYIYIPTILLLGYITLQFRAAHAPANLSHFHYVFYNIVQRAKNRSLPLLTHCHYSLEEQGHLLLAGTFSMRSLALGNFWMLGTFLPPVALPSCSRTMPAACQGCSFRRRCPLPLGSPPARLLCSPPCPGHSQRHEFAPDTVRGGNDLSCPREECEGCAGPAAAAFSASTHSLQKAE